MLATALNRLAAPLAGTFGLPREIDEVPILLTQDVTTHGGILEIAPVFIVGDTLGPERAPMNDVTVNEPTGG